ncbi:MAG: hypothetical protein ACK4ND_13480 [Cytophagaceae bacterium]
MKKPYYIILLFISFFSYAQRDVGKVQVLISKPTDVNVISDTLGTQAYLFQSKKQFQLSILDNQYQTQKNIIINLQKPDKNEVVLGSIIHKEEVVVHLFNSKSRQLSSLKINRSTGSHVFNKIGIFGLNDQYLSSFEINGHFYLLTVPSGTNALKVWKSDRGADFELKDYNIEYPEFYKSLISNNNSLSRGSFSKANIEMVSYELENNIKSTHSNKKLYVLDGKIIMTFDTPEGTNLITIDPEEGTSEYKKMNFKIERGNTASSKQGNSFIYEKTLFRVTASPKQLNLSIINLDSMELLNNYNIFPESPIGINNGPIFSENSRAQVDEIDIVNKPTKFFKNLMAGELAIAVNKVDSSRHELHIGSYQEYIARNSGSAWGGPEMSVGFGSFYGPMGMGMGGMGMGMGGGGFYGAYGQGFYGWPGYYPYYGTANKRIKTVYFKSLMNTPYFDHEEGNVPKSLREKIIDFEQVAFRSNTPEFIRIIPQQDKVLLGYYIKGRKMYKLVEFQK